MENLRVNSFRIKLLVLLMSLAMLIGVVFNFNRTAVTNNVNAVSFDDTTSYVSVGEIFDINSKSLNDDNFYTLLKYISGNPSATMDDIDALASSVTDASEMRAFTLDAGSEGEVDYSAKTNSQDIIVRLGGLDWQAMYLSQDKLGNAILTLWLDNNKQDAWEGRSATEGEFYGFIDGALYSDWSYNWSSDSTAVAYPSAMYGTSYINAVTLNNGGMYATSNTAVTTGVEKSADNPFAVFTMEEYGLTEHIVTPRQVSWQEDQSAKTINSMSYNYPNEAWSNSTTGDGFYNGTDGISEYNYAYNTATGAIREENDDWADSYLWLPSMSETGYNTSKIGLWKTSTEQRMNYDGSTTSSPGSVGFTSGTAYPYSWLRSGKYNNANYAYTLNPSGANNNNSNVNYSYAVRPSLHLNLNSVELSSTRVSIDGGSMSVSSSEEEFNGCEKTPTVAVTIDGEPLVENTDYTLVYTLNGEEVDELWSAGEYTITAKGKGDYRGSLSTTYTINPTALVGITLSSTSETYNTSSIIPTVTVSADHGLEELIEGEEFVVTYKNSAGTTITASQMVNAGTYTIIATGIGNFTGEVSTTFTIEPREIPSSALTIAASSFEYTGQPVELNPVVVVDGETLVEDRDYAIELVKRTGATGEIVESTIDVSQYFIIARGMGNYTGSSVNEFAIVACDITNATFSTISSYPYITTEITQNVTLKFGNTTLIEGTDYTETYSNNINVGTATITFEGIGNYTGTVAKTFQIYARDLDTIADNDPIEDQTYTGSAITPTPVAVIV